MSRKSANETVWARSPAPHTAVNSREKESTIYKSASEAVWARSPAPHTTINSIGREERRKREREQFCYSFIQTLYSKIFMATIIIIIIITTIKIAQEKSRREEREERERRERRKRREREESDLPEHMRA